MVLVTKVGVNTGEWQPETEETKCAYRPVPSRKTQTWLIDSAAGSSKAALVSSICWRFVCRSLPATQQPNIASNFSEDSELEEFTVHWFTVHTTMTSRVVLSWPTVAHYSSPWLSAVAGILWPRVTMMRITSVQKTMLSRHLSPYSVTRREAKERARRMARKMSNHGLL